MLLLIQCGMNECFDSMWVVRVNAGKTKERGRGEAIEKEILDVHLPRTDFLLER